MHSISNQQRAEIEKLLAAFSQQPATDNKDFNLKRRARIVLAKLKKTKKQ